MHRGAIAEIDLDAVTHNLGIVKKITENRPVIAVVKADAYGHGAIEVSRRLVNEGVSALAVAFTDEAIKLREAGIDSPIVVLFDKCDSADILKFNLIPVIHDLHSAKRLSEEARKRGNTLNVHVKVDTGMGRIGFNGAGVLRDIVAVSKMDYLNIAGLMSHFSDSDIADKSYARLQIERFNAVRDILRKVVKSPPLCHIANSAATLSFRDAHFDAVRPGLILYGYSPMQKSETIEAFRLPNFRASELKPAMRIKTQILSLRKLQKGTPVSYGRTFITRRKSLIAVLPVGYADGFSRAFSNNADVLVKGKRAPVVGRVCMDLTMIDVTDIERMKEGDEVVLIGRQGRGEITATEIAIKAGTIPYEILTAIGNRSRRIYKC